MGELLLEPSQCWLQWQELVTLHTQLRTAWVCSDGPLLLLCMCCPLAPELEGWAKRGAVGPFLEGEGRKCPSKGSCCSEPRSRQQSSVFALSPCREEPFTHGHPSSPTLPHQCPSWHRAHAGTGSDTVPAPCPVCSTHHPCPQQAGAATPPAPAAPLASAPLLRQGCVSWHRLIVDHCCGHAKGVLQALLLFQLREGRERQRMSAEPPKGTSEWLSAGQRGDTGG